MEATTQDDAVKAPEKVMLSSMDITEEKLKQLKQLLPEVFNENKLDFERFQQFLGKNIDTGKERYCLSWPGKAESIQIAHAPSLATLTPCREESVNWASTENLFIEGDNLEVLKLLQKSYFGKVKMIYIDPPYNTGKEFIYPDNYQQSIAAYEAYTGQLGEDGKRLSTNKDYSGRFHSKWLNMMYKRLLLAKNLLREDGVIFISIDDNEQANLKKLCDEVFGEENFFTTIAWQKKYAATNDAKGFSTTHDYILAYRKSSLFQRNLLPRTAKQNAPYKYDDNDGRGLWRTGDLLVKSFSSSGVYPIKNPNTGKEYYPQKGSCWRASQETMERWIAENRVYFGKDGKGAPQLKRYLNEVQQGRVPTTWWTFEEAGHNDAANKELRALFDSSLPFDTPKPTSLIKLMAQVATDKNDIILDFFSGSSTTAHAVMQLNAEDGGHRKYIMVQLPEKCEATSEAFKAGYKTIAEIGKERIRRAAEKIKKTYGNTDKLDLGFKVFKLQRSHFIPWNADVPEGDVEQLTMQLNYHVERLQSTTGDEPLLYEPLLYELLLKQGISLTDAITSKTVADNKHVFFVDNGKLLICLEDKLTLTVIDAMLTHKPEKMIVKDSAFAGNDEVKVNAMQTLKTFNHQHNTHIVLQTV